MVLLPLPAGARDIVDKRRFLIRARNLIAVVSTLFAVCLADV